MQTTVLKKLRPLTIADVVNIAQYNPWHANQLADSAVFPVNNQCPTVLFQQAYQVADRASRDDIQIAIDWSEQTARRYLGFYTSETYVKIRIPVTPVNLISGTLGVERFITKIGTLVETIVDVSPVAYIDQNGDGVLETATISFPAPLDIHSYAYKFVDADTYEERYVQPKRVNKTGSTIVATFDTFNLVKPLQQMPSFPPKALPALPIPGAVYATSLSVIERTYVNTNTMRIVNADGVVQQTVSCQIEDSVNGIICFDNACITYHCNECDLFVELNAVVGDFYDWRNTLTKLAIAELPKPFCSCSTANRYIFEWQLSYLRPDGETQITASDLVLQCEIGTKIGHFLAWQQFGIATRRKAFRA